jgi:hypothetical protein
MAEAGPAARETVPRVFESRSTSAGFSISPMVERIVETTAPSNHWKSFTLIDCMGD